MMTFTIPRFAFLFLLLALACTASTTLAAAVRQVPDRVVITLREDVAPDPAKASGPAAVGVPGLDTVAARLGVRSVARLHPGMAEQLAHVPGTDHLDRVFAVDFPAELGLEAVKAAYENLPEVAEVRLVDIYPVAAYLPDDPSLVSQYYLRNLSLGGADVRAVGGWNQTLGDSNVVIAIIDTGVDWHHPDLGGPHPDKVNGAILTNWTEYYGAAGNDDDGNGYVDDIRGWDFLDYLTSEGWPGEDMRDQDNDPMDFASHGTACAGCAAAITNNGLGIAGTAPGCKIMALRAGYLGADGLGWLRSDAIASAMYYAAANGADIINASWGSSAYLTAATTACLNAGVLIVTAAGNDNTDSGIGVPSYLSTRNGVLAVAATDQLDTKASFSNYGTWVEISAPGVAIYTTWYNHSTDTSTYSSVQGTSFASPITAGAAALVWSANPGLNYSQVSAILMDSADDLDAKNPSYMGLLGAGRVNLLAALGDNQHRYPDEFPTLYDALNSAAALDTIAVKGGTVITDAVTVPAKQMKVYGGYSADYTSRDPLGNPSIIDGNTTTAMLRFLANADHDTEVNGFRIQDGGGVFYSGLPFSARFGGGIILKDTSPTLRNLVVTGNGVGSSTDLGAGGGIMMSGSGSLLENVTITGNEAVLGGGLYAYDSTPTLVSCSITDNTLITDNLSDPPNGGGIYALDSNLTLVDCDISGHLGAIEGGGVYLAGSSGVSNLDMTGGTVSGNSAKEHGAGIFQDGGILDIAQTVVSQNLRTPSANLLSGSGVYVSLATATLDSVVLTGNDSHLGGGLMFEDCPVASLTNSVVTGNVSIYYGAGLVLQNCTAVTLGHNTIAENDGTLAGAGGIYATGTALSMNNTILAFNTGGTTYANGLALLSGSAAVTCGDAYGNLNADFSGLTDPTGSGGNISADPLFCNAAAGNFGLDTSSPCASGATGGCGLIGALTDDCGLSAVGDGDGSLPAAPLAFRVEPNFPNPFNPRTTIRFALPAEEHTVVSVFDVRGQRVKTLLNEKLPAQVHEITWSGRDDRDRSVAAGVYFYLVTSGDNRSVGRMALIK